MSVDPNYKVIREIINLTPLIIDTKRDAARFQDALVKLSNPKLKNFYHNLSPAEQQRFHYVANLCLGYESWQQLYKLLVVKPTQEKLLGQVETLYYLREEELVLREAALEEECLSIGTQIMGLESENLALRKRNQRLQDELASYKEHCRRLDQQKTQFQHLVEKYQKLIKELRALLAKSSDPSQP
jgi:hypothetical protein